MKGIAEVVRESNIKISKQTKSVPVTSNSDMIVLIIIERKVEF